MGGSSNAFVSWKENQMEFPSQQRIKGKETEGKKRTEQGDK